MKNNIYKIALVSCLAVLTLSSCNDFLTIYPTDKTVDDDFWKTKSDVDGMVSGAYKSMISSDIQKSLIIWGAYRSDELEKGGDLLNIGETTNNDMANIYAVNLLPDNQFNSWGKLYTVINSCNMVLKRAPEVKALDPNYTDGDYENSRAQMLALRSLCYFYLVRAFRDVPYTTEPYKDDSQTLTIAQDNPGDVLKHCIEDLTEAEKVILHRGAYVFTSNNSWKNTGYFNRESVEALLADVYLWRASITHSTDDYQQTVTWADKVIDNMDIYYRTNATAAEINKIQAGDKYHLLDIRDAM